MQVGSSKKPCGHVLQLLQLAMLNRNRRKLKLGDKQRMYKTKAAFIDHAYLRTKHACHLTAYILLFFFFCMRVVSRAGLFESGSGLKLTKILGLIRA